jgi:HSP20 family molecular chaperone IbpA
MFFTPVLRTRAVSPGFRAFDRGFERFVNEALRGDAQARATVEQDEAAWTITLDVPGVTREELEIGIEANVVRITTKAEAKRQYKAAYEMPQDVDVATSEARLDNGVLTLKLGKKAPVSNVSQLAVN